jgi:hypothetical protein
MGFKGGFAAFVDGYQRSSESAANRARMESQDRRAEESAQYQRTRDAAQDKRHATDDAYTEEARGRQRKDWAQTDNLDKIERDTRAEPDAADAAPVTAPQVISPVATSANYNPSAASLSSPGMTDLINKLASAPAAAGLTPYDKEMKLAKRLAQAAGGAERAQGIIARAKTMRNEGVLDTLNHLEANDPQAAWEAFNGSGAARMPPGSKFVQDGKSKDPYTGVEKPTWKLVGQDGAVINPDVRGSVYANVFTPKERMAFESSRTNNDAKLAMAHEKLEQAKFIAQMRVASAGARAAAGAGQQPTAAFDSLQGFDPKEAQSAATKLVDEAIAGSGKPLTPQQRADAIAKQTFALRDAYASNNGQRERARVFSNAARGASTPAQIAEVRARAMQSGYTDAEMVAIDPRFAAPAGPAR